MKILFVQTGGTIDKDYPQGETEHGYEFQIGEPAAAAILFRANPAFSYEVVSLLKKDSRDIDEQDRRKVRDFLESSDDSKIVMTHGTDTIQQTGDYLRGIPSKTIVLTGAMLPEKFYDSDAEFNLGMAVAVAQTASEGVYIVLGGIVEKVS